MLTKDPTRASRKILVAATVALAILVIVAPLSLYIPQVTSIQPVTRQARTKVQLVSVSEACRAFHKHLNRWPTNLAELHQNPADVMFYDGRMTDQWQRPLIYQPPTDTAHGLLGTHGADALTQGDKSDGDQFLIITNTARITERL